MLKLPPSEHSLWRESYTTSIYPTLLGSIHVDVIVIGGGITGLTTAYLLKKQGRTVAVLEKDTIGGGTSGRTTGKVSSQHNLIYGDLLKRHGRVIARGYGYINQAAIEQIETIITSENITCDWRREDNYVFTDEQNQVSSLEYEARIASELGLPAIFETTTPLPFPVRGAVRFTNQAKFNSQQYLLGLAQAIDGDGSFVFERSNATHIQTSKAIEVGTKQGRVTAQDIVVATNVPTLPLTARGTYCILEYPQESYIVAAKVPTNVEGMYISPDKQHYSILPITIDGQPHVLIGGKGHISGLRGSTTARYQQLADYAETHFNATEISYRWSDRDYLAYDRLPLIGPLYPSSEHIYVASAFSKWGLSGGTAAAMILTDLITGKNNPYAEMFTPHRAKAVAAIPRVIARHLTGKS